MDVMLFYSSLLLLSLAVSVHPLVRCRKCRTSLGLQICEDNCDGDACFYTETFPSLDNRMESSTYGCVLGSFPQTAMGCRANQDGQKLCLCSTDMCNGDPANMTDLRAPRKLPVQACECVRVHPNFPNTTFLRPCAASFCVYERTEISSLFNLTSSSFSAGCSRPLDFDLFNSNSRFFTYPETCLLETDSGSQRVTTCYTRDTTLQIGSLSVVPPIVATRCLTGYTLPFGAVDPFSQGNCTGEFCVLSVARDKSVHRGCLTTMALASFTGTSMGVGYYLDIDGREEWLCAGSDNCNADLATLVATWPAGLEEYANLTLASSSYKALLPLQTLPQPLTGACSTVSLLDGVTRFVLMLSGLFAPQPILPYYG